MESSKIRESRYEKIFNFIIHEHVAVLYIIAGLTLLAKALIALDPLSASISVILLTLTILCQYLNKTTSQLREVNRKYDMVIDDFKARIDESVKYQSVNVRFKANDNDEDHAYETSKKVIRSAEKHIWVLADYSPETEPLTPPNLREAYYKEIEEKIKNMVALRKNFHYVRIMQRDNETFQRVFDNHGVIDSPEMIAGDVQAFEHCSRILDIIEEAIPTRVEVELIVARFIPSMPSILLVDKNHLLFTIPKKVKHSSTLDTAGVIRFYDNKDGGAIVDDFKKIFETIRIDDEKITLKKIDKKIFASYRR